MKDCSGMGSFFSLNDKNLVFVINVKLHIWFFGIVGDVNVKVGPGVNLDMLVESKTSSISTQLEFSTLEKYTDHIQKYDVTKGQIGDKPKSWKIENHFGHVRIEEGDWMNTLKFKIPNFDP